MKRPVLLIVLVILLGAACVFLPRMFNLSPLVAAPTSLEPSSTPTPTPPIDTPAIPTLLPQSSEATLTALADSPVQGAVIINEGRPMGAIAGTSIEIPAAFSASSRAGSVVEMRTRGGNFCVKPEELAAEPWEPFRADKSFSFMPPINWVGFYVTVQFRDSAGNLSPLYCDDISVEGMPPLTP